MSGKTNIRTKLGLALSGGGFRASFFHLGVLRRLAELDVLRRVEVLSAVSGGSILAALYLLVLKKYLDRDASLGRKDYVRMVEELEDKFVRGVRKNLRTRLLLNPLATLRIICTPRTLAERMGRLYERYLYRDTVAELWPGRRRWWRPGRVPLKDVRLRPGGDPLDGGIEAYNADEAKACKVPKLVFNATTLNSGRGWRFTAVEMGDPLLGYIRYDEIDLLSRYRQQLAERTVEELYPLLDRPPDGFASASVAAATLWRFWRDAREAGAVDFQGYLRKEGRLKKLDPSRWPVIDVLCRPGFATRRFMECELGELRVAKLEAWYLRRAAEREPPVALGIPGQERERRFWLAVREIGADIWQDCRRESKTDPLFLDALLDFVIDLYQLRTSVIVGSKAERDFGRITLGDAVAASACFPPVFPPYTLLGLYDDTHVATLRLTDGGVFDNQGINALFEEECTHIIASDAGGTLEVQGRVTAGRLGMMGRIVSILMANVRDQQLGRLREKHRVAAGLKHATGASAELEELKERYRLARVAFFHMGTRPEDGDARGLDPHPDAEAIAHIRTDLDAFGDAEIAALTYQGYALADRFVRRYLKASSFATDDWQPARRPPLPLMQPPPKQRRALKVGAHRFFRALILGAVEAWIFTLAAAGAAIYLSWRLRLSLRDILGYLHVVAELLWPFDVDRRISLGLLILAVVAVVAVLIAWPKVMDRLRRVRRLVTAVKWARALSGNMLWPFGFLPLWLSLLGSLIAGVSHFVYGRAFLRVTGYFGRGTRSTTGA